MRYLPLGKLRHAIDITPEQFTSNWGPEVPYVDFNVLDLIPITARLKDDLLQSEQEFGKGLASPDTTTDPDADHEADHDKP